MTRSMVRWWAAVAGGAALTLLFAWLGRLAGVPASTLLTVGGGVAALMWTVVLVTLPWNLHFDARQVLRENAVARSRGIDVPPEQDREAGTIARRTLWLALGGHLVTAAVTAVFALATGAVAGYYLATFFLLTTAVRPATAFLRHLRVRLTVLGRANRFPRDDVAAVKLELGSVSSAVDVLRTRVEDAFRAVNDDLARLRRQVTDDVSRVETTQAADRSASRDRDAELRGRVEQMARRIEATLDGISDHQELLTGIRALVRMIRGDMAPGPAGSS